MLQGFVVTDECYRAWWLSVRQGLMVIDECYCYKAWWLLMSTTTIQGLVVIDDCYTGLGGY